MIKSKTFLVCSVCFLVTTTAWAGSKTMQARADLVVAAGKTIGAAALSEKMDGVEIVLKARLV